MNAAHAPLRIGSSRTRPAAALLTLLAATLGTSPAPALELQGSLGTRGIHDPGIYYVSDSPGLTTLELGVQAPLRSRPHLLWSLSYEAAGASLSDAHGGGYYYDYMYYEPGPGATNPPGTPLSDELASDLRLHTLLAGVRLERPILPWFVPYARVSAGATLGRMRLESEGTAWSYPDPDDPSGETLLYTIEPAQALGLGAGVQVGAGLTLRFPLSPSPSGSSATGSGAAAPPGSSHSPAASSTAAGVPSQLSWGLSLEMRYALVTPLSFGALGRLEVGGPQVVGSISFQF